MTLFERAFLYFQPIRDYLVPFIGFDALVSLALTVMVAAVIFQNRRENQSVTAEIENLIRRYIIFRGHRQALLRIHNGDEKVKHEILKAISNSWNHFKDTLERHFAFLQEADRHARSVFLILGAIMVLNSLRTFAFGVLAGKGNWASLVLLVRELPPFLFLITGLLLVRTHSQRWGKRPLASFSKELEAIFSDMEKTQEALDNEFDPIE